MGAKDLSENQQDALLVAAQVCATFSLCGSLFVLACYEALPHLRKLSFTLVAWLAFADIGESIRRKLWMSWKVVQYSMLACDRAWSCLVRIQSRAYPRRENADYPNASSLLL